MIRLKQNLRDRLKAFEAFTDRQADYYNTAQGKCELVLWATFAAVVIGFSILIILTALGVI
jgi:hypothetical protein